MSGWRREGCRITASPDLNTLFPASANLKGECFPQRRFRTTTAQVRVGDYSLMWIAGPLGRFSVRIRNAANCVRLARSFRNFQRPSRTSGWSSTARIQIREVSALMTGLLLHPFAFAANACDNHERRRAVAWAMLAGTRSSTSVPASTSLHTVSLAPIIVARSRIPGKP